MADKQVIKTDVSATGTETVRVLRVLEYIGTREWVESTLRQGLGPSKVFVCPKGEIRMTVVGDWPQTVREEYSTGVQALIQTVGDTAKQIQENLDNGFTNPEGLLREIMADLINGLNGLAFKGNVVDRQVNRNR